MCKGLLDDVDEVWKIQTQKPIGITATICRIKVGTEFHETFDSTKHLRRTSSGAMRRASGKHTIEVVPEECLYFDDSL